MMRAEMHIAMDFVVNFTNLAYNSIPDALRDPLLNMYVFRRNDHVQRKSRNWLNQISIIFRGISPENRALL